MAISKQDRHNILAWAGTQGEILEIWLYQGYARSDFKAKGRIDLVIVTAGANLDQRYRTWSGARWRVELGLSQRVQIEWYDAYSDDLTIIGPEIRHDCQLIYWTREVSE